jgi:RimJ/RimL family protein N-acetyltransferase
MLLNDGCLALYPFEEAESILYREWVNQEEFARLLGRSLPVTEAEHNGWYQDSVRDKNSVIFAVKTLDGTQYLGNVWLHNIHWINRNAELRILLGAPEYRGKGHGTKACLLLLRFAFEKLGLQKVYLYVSAVNPRAFRAFEKAGFQEEGHLKSEFFVDGQFVDVKRMAVLNPAP